MVRAMSFPRCAQCGDVIGVYEPARVTLADGTELRGSWVTLRSALELTGISAVHEHCYHARKPDDQSD